MSKLTEKQAGVLSWMAGHEWVSWSDLRRATHAWTRGSLHERGLIDMANHPHADEIWFITPAGREALREQS